MQKTTPSPRQTGRPAGVAFVLVTLAIDSLGIGLVVPIVPELVRILSGEETARASIAVGALVATFALAQLIGAPILGGLSDRFGRRPVLLLSIAGIGANYVLLAWAPSLPWLFLGRALAGITSANVSTANAYIADVTPPAARGGRFGLVGAVFSCGFVLGPALGGLLGAINLRLPFMVAAGLAACNALYGLLVLPESLPPERRQKFNWKGADPLSALRTLAADPVTLRLAAGWACMWFALGTLMTVFVLSTELRFGWGPGENGAALALVGTMGAVVQGFLVRRVIGKLGERRAALGGFALSTLAYTVFAVAPAGWWIYVAICINSLGQVANPAVRALVSSRAGPERQGRAMGALSVIEGLTAIASPVIASGLFSVFAAPDAILHFPGAPFIAAGCGYLIAIVAVRAIAKTEA